VCKHGYGAPFKMSVYFKRCVVMNGMHRGVVVSRRTVLSRCVVYNGVHRCVDNYYAPPKINYILHAVRKICVCTVGGALLFCRCTEG
jgi:hypothetical protein